jgi:predicted nucleic acid-binding protein
MTSVEPGVLDANVLAYAANADALQHEASSALLEAAGDPAIALYVTSQILCEFYSIVTNPRRVAAACSSREALNIVSAMLALPGLHVLPTPSDAVAGWMRLLERRPVTGANVFDLQIVATMQANGIQRIYTFNTADFAVFPELSVLTPAPKGGPVSRQ